MTAGEFVEATVLEALPEHLRLQTADGSRSLKVSQTDVYSLVKPELETRAGHFGLCRVKRSSWSGCRVVGHDTSTTRVKTPDFKEYTLPRESVLVVTALTRMNIEHVFARAERRHDFQLELQQAGSPIAPPKWRPGPRERVVARRNDDWFAARVHELEEDGVRVRWRGTQEVEKLASDDVVAEPPFPEKLQRGEFALMRPRAEAQPWVYVRVRAVGDDYKVEDIKGEVLQASATQLIPIRPR